jgi:thioredoxin 1
MSIAWKILVVAALAAAVVVIFTLKKGRTQETNASVSAPVAATADTSGNSPAPAVDASDESQPLPRLVDVGAGTCIPCKMMMPVLAELKTRYAGRLRVEYCDIRDDPNAVQKYRIMVIPTQILYDASGAESFRHEGFWPRVEIEQKLAEMGVQ